MRSPTSLAVAVCALLSPTLTTGWALTGYSARDGVVTNFVATSVHQDAVFAISAYDENGLGSRDLMFVTGSTDPGEPPAIGAYVTAAISALPDDTLSRGAQLGGLLCNIISHVYRAEGLQLELLYYEVEMPWGHSFATAASGIQDYIWVACETGMPFSGPTFFPAKDTSLILGTLTGHGCDTSAVWGAATLVTMSPLMAAFSRADDNYVTQSLYGKIPLTYGDFMPGSAPGECLCNTGWTGYTCGVDRSATCAVATGCSLRALCLAPTKACSACVAGWNGPACSFPNCVEDTAAWGINSCGGPGVGHCASSTEQLCECEDPALDPRTHCEAKLSIARGSQYVAAACYAPSGGLKVLGGSFILFDDVFGSACSGRGVCYKGLCACDAGYVGTWCQQDLPPTCIDMGLSVCRYTTAATLPLEVLARCDPRLYIFSKPTLVPPLSASGAGPRLCVAARGRVASTLDWTASQGGRAIPGGVEYRNGVGHRLGTTTGSVLCLLPRCMIPDDPPLPMGLVWNETRLF